VTYEKSYEETTIKVLITKVRGLKSDNTIRFPSRINLYCERQRNSQVVKTKTKKGLTSLSKED
jgi:hypothetical protein